MVQDTSKNCGFVANSCQVYVYDPPVMMCTF